MTEPLFEPSLVFVVVVQSLSSLDLSFPTSKSGKIYPDNYMQAKASASFIVGVQNGENEVQRRECLNPCLFYKDSLF